MAKESAVCEVRDFCEQQKQPQLSGDIKIAVQIHIFYTDLIPELVAALQSIGHPFDLYVTTDNRQKADEIQAELVGALTAEGFLQKTEVKVCGNQGRDVIPFLQQIAPVCRQYAYICHLHTKKSKDPELGDAWRKYLYQTLLGNRSVVDNVLQLFETDPAVGMIFPETFPALVRWMNWGVNKKLAVEIADSVGVKVVPFMDGKKEVLIFPAGNMFWARSEAVQQLLCYPLADSDIPPEKGQLDGTIMHAFERLWSYTAKHNGYRTVLMKANYAQAYMLGERKGPNRLADTLLPYGSRRRALVKWLISPFRK